MSYTTDLSSRNISVTRVTGDGQLTHNGNTTLNGALSVRSVVKSRVNQSSLFHLAYDPPRDPSEIIKGDEPLTMVRRLLPSLLSIHSLNLTLTLTLTLTPSHLD